MQIATMLSLAGTITCLGIFTSHKKWTLALAFLFASTYTVLHDVIHVAAVPGLLLQSLPYVFLALVVFAMLRTLVAK